MMGLVLESLDERGIQYKCMDPHQSSVRIPLRFGNFIQLQATPGFHIEGLLVDYFLKGMHVSAFSIWHGAIPTVTSRDAKAKHLFDVGPAIGVWVNRNNEYWPPILSSAIALWYSLQCHGVVRDVRRLIVQNYLDAACHWAREKIKTRFHL